MPTTTKSSLNWLLLPKPPTTLWFLANFLVKSFLFNFKEAYIISFYSFNRMVNIIKRFLKCLVTDQSAVKLLSFWQVIEALAPPNFNLPLSIRIFLYHHHHHRRHRQTERHSIYPRPIDIGIGDVTDWVILTGRTKSHVGHNCGEAPHCSRLEVMGKRPCSRNSPIPPSLISTK